jgi:hypothetical protein
LFWARAHALFGTDVCDALQAVYDRVLELRIATPQIILNYAAFLQVNAMHACMCHILV